MGEIEKIVADLTEPQRALMEVGAGELVEAGIGTWKLLQRKGLLDARFELTPLGQLVHHYLSIEKATS